MSLDTHQDYWSIVEALSRDGDTFTALYYETGHNPWQEIFNALYKDTLMTNLPEHIPAPNVDHAEWVAKMAKLPDSLNLRDYRAAGGKDARLYLIEGARRISMGMQDKLLKVQMNNIQDERVNCYSLTDEAKAFWQNGAEQNMSPQEILDGWKAMQSIIEESAKPE